MNLKELLEEIKSDFQGSRILTFQRDLEDLIGFYLELSWSELKTNKNIQISPEKKEIIKQAINRFNTGEPLAYIIQEKYFYKSLFKVDNRVLVPRPETEILVEQALKLLPNEGRLIDLGTGSGCIGISLAKEKPNSNVLLIDVDKEALALCRENGERLGVHNVEYLQLDVGEENTNQLNPVDIVVANPPYIEKGDSRVEDSVHQFEPHVALYSKELGLYLVRLWLNWSFEVLRPKGHYIFEFGEGQEKAILELIKKTPFQVVHLINDYSKTPRFYLLQKP